MQETTNTNTRNTKINYKILLIMKYKGNFADDLTYRTLLCWLHTSPDVTSLKTRMTSSLLKSLRLETKVE